MPNGVQAMLELVIRGCGTFCGAGGSSAGARTAGVEMVGAIDMCPTATATYRANFPDAHVVTGRLERVAMDAFKEKVGEVDILLASPECRNHTMCQGFRSGRGQPGYGDAGHRVRARTRTALACARGRKRRLTSTGPLSRSSPIVKSIAANWVAVADR